MHRFGVWTILTILFLVDASGEKNKEKKGNLSSENETASPIEGLTSRSKKNSTERGKPDPVSQFWMNVYGPLQHDLFAAQAVIVKEEAFDTKCDRGDRRKRRHLMCAGSILSANLVLTSATCIHTATHIRHNIRGTLAVAISPIKASMEIIRVIEYKIHDKYNPWPLAPTFVKNNLAILKLACRIKKENFHKIVVPRVPFQEGCSEGSCLVTVYRRMKETNWVMYQMFAPNMTLPDRRKKATMTRDREAIEMDKSKINELVDFGKKRAKRRLAGPPNFATFYESRDPKKGSNFSGPSTTTENSLVGSKPSEKSAPFVEAINLEDEDLTDFAKSIGNETLRTLVPRSLGKRFGCAHSGAAVMLDATQYAIAVLPCDDRRTDTKWAYADLFENLDWIDGVMQEWDPDDKIQFPGEQRSPEVSDHNSKSCSTCIFNFFIDLGCKGKGRCGNKTMSVQTEKGDEYERAGESIVLDSSKSCGNSKGLGVDIGIGGRGCTKKRQKLGPAKNSNNRKSWGKSYVPRIVGRSDEATNRRQQPTKLRQPLNVASSKGNLIKDPPAGDKDRLSRKKNPPNTGMPSNIVNAPSASSTNYNLVPRSEDKKVEKTSNEIRLQNIEAHSNYWMSEHQNPFGISSDAKRRLMESARSP